MEARVGPFHICNDGNYRIKHGVRGLAGNGPPLELKAAGAGDDVLCRSTVDEAHVDRRERRAEEAVLLGTKLGGEFLDRADQARGVVDGGDTLVGVGAVRLFAGDGDLGQAVAFPRTRRVQLRGFADDHAPRVERVIGQQMRCADAADLLVGAEDNAESVEEFRFARGSSQDAGQKTFYVAGSASVEHSVLDLRVEGVLPVWREGNGVAVAHQDQVGVVVGDVLPARRGDQVYLFDLLRIAVRERARGPAGAMQDLGGIFDYGTVRDGGVRWDADQMREVIDHG